MSEQNQLDGANHYADGDVAAKLWFARQWAAWPKRVDERYTTNISFLYGGLTAYRVEHGCEPKLSEQFASNVAYLDKHP